MPQENIAFNYKQTMDSRPMSLFQIMIVAICFILNMNDGIDVLVVSYSSSEIIKEWSLSKIEMGYVFSIGLFGMMLGSFFIAPWGDKIGRRKIFIIGLLAISTGMFLVSACTNYSQLLIFRFITGLGIGSILPTLAATAAEFSNQKSRDFNVGLIQAGWPLGAIFAGFYCAYAIPHFGWRYTFFIAGCFSFSMLVLVVYYMRDSFRFLITKQPKNALKKINKVLQKAKLTTIETLPNKPITDQIGSFKNLLTPHYFTTTIQLWVAIFFGFLTLYTLMSWVPNIAKESGLPFSLATYAGVLLNVGATIGTISVGWIAGRFGLRKTVTSFLFIAFIIMLVYGNFHLTTVFIFILIFLIGTFVQGGFNGIYAIIARAYPTQIRNTGAGIAIGIGRLGAILGPTLFGFLSGNGASIASLFSLFSIPLIIMGMMVIQLKSERVN